MANKVVLYATIIIICIIAIGVGVYSQFFGQEIGPDELVSGVTKQEEDSSSIKSRMISEFDYIFRNSILSVDNARDVNKQDESKDIVYAEHTFKDTKQDIYMVNVNIPHINIDSTVVDAINKDISEIFLKKTTNVLTKSTKYTIYNLDYTAYINADVLSLVIKATLKEGDDVQRVIIKTYNYSLLEDKEVKLEELISLKGLSKSSVQNIIGKQIKKYDEENLSLKALGYEGYQRNLDDDMYKIENTYNYFLGQNNYLYIIYSYGNSDLTSEIDIVLF